MPHPPNFMTSPVHLNAHSFFLNPAGNTILFILFERKEKKRKISYIFNSFSYSILHQDEKNKINKTATLLKEKKRNEKK